MTFITGFLAANSNENSKEYQSLVTQFLAACPRARGHDDIGILTRQSCTLAARARRTRDLSLDGAQPAQDAQGRMTVILDGYIANADSLRHALEAEDQHLRGRADAELVAMGAAHWGLNRLLQKLEGAFVFALWDDENKTLHLVRDRMGLRPLYWTRHRDMVAFASDYRAFAALPDFVPVHDPAALADYLAWGHIAAPRAPWKGVYTLPPAHRLMLADPGTDTQPESYRSAARALEEIALRDTPATQPERLNAECVQGAIALDVPFGLIGDSTPAGGRLHATLSAMSERPFLARTLAAPDGVLLQTAFDALAALPEPVCDPAAPAWWAALQAIPADTPVCLAATPLSRPIDEDARARRLRRMLARIPRLLHPLLPQSWRARAEPAGTACVASARIWPQFGETPDLPEPRLDLSPARTRAYYGFLHDACGGYFAALDRIANAADVELRLPLADTRMLEHGFPARIESAPADIVTWMRGPLRPRIAALLDADALARAGLPDPAPFHAAWLAFLGGDDAQAHALWTLATLLAWIQKNVAPNQVA